MPRKRKHAQHEERAYKFGYKLAMKRICQDGIAALMDASDGGDAHSVSAGVSITRDAHLDRDPSASSSFAASAGDSMGVPALLDASDGGDAHSVSDGGVRSGFKKEFTFCDQCGKEVSISAAKLEAWHRRFSMSPHGGGT